MDVLSRKELKRNDAELLYLGQQILSNITDASSANEDGWACNTDRFKTPRASLPFVKNLEPEKKQFERTNNDDIMIEFVWRGTAVVNGTPEPISSPYHNRCPLLCCASDFCNAYLNLFPIDRRQSQL